MVKVTYLREGEPITINRESLQGTLNELADIFPQLTANDLEVRVEKGNEPLPNWIQKHGLKNPFLV